VGGLCLEICLVLAYLEEMVEGYFPLFVKLIQRFLSKAQKTSN
jgi:hypothetical protein